MRKKLKQLTAALLAIVVMVAVGVFAAGCEEPGPPPPPPQQPEEPAEWPPEPEEPPQPMEPILPPEQEAPQPEQDDVETPLW